MIELGFPVPVIEDKQSLPHGLQVKSGEFVQNLLKLNYGQTPSLTETRVSSSLL